MTTFQTLKTALSSDSLAYASLANVISAEHLQINPKRTVSRLLVSACLMSGGMLAMFFAIAGVSGSAGSPEAEGFIVILFWAGLLVSLTSLLHMVLNASYAVVIQHVLLAEKEVALLSQTEEVNEANYEGNEAAALRARLAILLQEHAELQEKFQTLAADKLYWAAQLMSEEKKKSDQAAVRPSTIRGPA